MEYAIVKTGGKQYKISEGDKLKIEKLNIEKGSEVELGKVLLWSDGEKVITGPKAEKETKVIAEVLSHKKDKKVVIFKYKKRVNYHRRKGHRQPYTEVLVKKIKKIA